jgi:hypothetical protein
VGLEYLFSLPSLNHMCNVLLFTPMATTRDCIVVLCKGILVTYERPTSTLLSPRILWFPRYNIDW